MALSRVRKEGHHGSTDVLGEVVRCALAAVLPLIQEQVAKECAEVLVQIAALPERLTAAAVARSSKAKNQGETDR